VKEAMKGVVTIFFDGPVKKVVMFLQIKEATNGRSSIRRWRNIFFLGDTVQRCSSIFQIKEAVEGNIFLFAELLQIKTLLFPLDKRGD
jgi:hypothetical protein